MAKDEIVVINLRVGETRTSTRQCGCRCSRSLRQGFGGLARRHPLVKWSISRGCCTDSVVLGSQSFSAASSAVPTPRPADGCNGPGEDRGGCRANLVDQVLVKKGSEGLAAARRQLKLTLRASVSRRSESGDDRWGRGGGDRRRFFEVGDVLILRDDAARLGLRRGCCGR